MITLQEAKNYLKVEFDEDDDFISEIIKVAESYMRDGITDFDLKMKNENFKIKAKLCEKALIQNMYDERYLVSYRQRPTYVISSLMNQLEYGDLDV